MGFVATVENLDSGGVSTFNFKTLSSAEKFIDNIERQTYESPNKHTRNNILAPTKAIKSFIIYTSMKDLEIVTITKL